MRAVGRVGALTGAALLALAPIAGAAQPVRLPAPSERCRIHDARLPELSGLAADADAWYAVNDGGSSIEGYVLDPQDCSVRDVRRAGNDPYDVEDLALARDGTLWLADTGDNRLRRDTVALHALTPSGESPLYRLRYPDGPHNAEALLLDGKGVPYIITKEVVGPAGVYRPSLPLVDGATVPLERVASVTLGPTRTPGGPGVGSLDSTLVTGAATGRHGTVFAIRTYTDAYVYSAPAGDLVAALGRRPLRVPLPNEPQGEAIAFEPDGTLLSVSEELSVQTGSPSAEGAYPSGQQPVRAVPGVAAAAREQALAPAAEERNQDGSRGQKDSPPAKPADGQEMLSRNQALLIAAGAAALIVFLGGRVRHLFR